MKIKIRLQGHYKDASLMKEYAQTRLSFSLGRFSGRIASVDIRLHDENGPRGGVDHNCAILVRFKEGGRLRAESLEAGWQVAIDVAADRTHRSVGRYLESRRDFRYQSGAPSWERKSLS